MSSIYATSRTRLVHLLHFSSLVLLCACSTISGYPKTDVKDNVEISANQSYFASDVRRKEDAVSDTARGGLTRKEYRDAVVYGRLGVIDIRYREFQKALFSANNGLSIGADLTVLALNGFGATTGAAATKSALAAASAGIVGSKATVNTDLFYQKTLPALVAQMDAGRTKELVIIETGLTKPVDQYPLGEALNDVQNYYIAGTLPGAVQQTTASAGAVQAKAEQERKELTAVRSEAFVQAEAGYPALLDRIKKLTPAEALSAETAMSPKLSERTGSVQAMLKAQFPKLDKISDGQTAKRLLEAWVALDDRTPAFNQEWTDALNAATK